MTPDQFAADPYGVQPDPAMSEHLFDVIAVRIEDGARRVMERNLTKRNADAYISMAVHRRGVEDEYFTAVPSSDAAP